MRLSGDVEHSSSRLWAGFPWLFALTTYTISWGWSLIRPNSLYWDDWVYVFNQPKGYLSEIFTRTGLPPWRALIDQKLLGGGYWTLRWLTFVMFFVAGLFLFEILKQIPFVSLAQRRSIVLLFLIVPVNHARVALVMFGYTTSYFLFFLGWMLLVRYSRWTSVLATCACFAWSFMTHSFLIFVILPILHFTYLHREQIFRRKPNITALAQLGVLLGAPMLYYVLRSVYWPPDAQYLWYHTVYLRAVLVSMAYLVPFVVSAIGVVLWIRLGKRTSLKVLTITAGFLAFGIGVFPYISSGNLDSKTIFFFWELGWTSRHQLLMPLGASLLTVAIFDFIWEKKSRLILGIVSTALISLNIFWGIGAYVDSVKRDELVALLSVELANVKSSRFTFVDETRYLNFRGDVYRRYEFAAILLRAGKNPAPTVEDECNDDLNLTEVIIRSEKSLLEAFLSKDLALNLEIGPCESS